MYKRDVARKFLSRNSDVGGLEVKKVNKLIGKGLFVKRPFKRGEFLCEYAGDLITVTEGEQRERSYPIKLGSYLFFFKWRGKRFCVDATLNTERVCRYANDATGIQQNGVMLLDVFDERPHLCLYAARDILPGEEIRYDYGVKNLPWRKKVQSFQREKRPRLENDVENVNLVKGQPEESEMENVSAFTTITRSKSTRKLRKYYTKFRNLRVCSTRKKNDKHTSITVCSSQTKRKQSAFQGKHNYKDIACKPQVKRRKTSKCKTDNNFVKEQPHDPVNKLKVVKIVLKALTLQSIQDMGYETTHAPNMNETREPPQPKDIQTTMVNANSPKVKTGNMSGNGIGEAGLSRKDTNMIEHDQVSSQSVNEDIVRSSRTADNVNLELPKHDDTCPEPNGVQSIQDMGYETTHVPNMNETREPPQPKDIQTTMVKANSPQVKTGNRPISQLSVMSGNGIGEAGLSQKHTNITEHDQLSSQADISVNEHIVRSSRTADNVNLELPKHDDTCPASTGVNKYQRKHQRPTLSKVTHTNDMSTPYVSTAGKKPHRPCFFCGKLQSKLSLHLKRKHAEEDRVKNALLLPQVLQQRAFDKIRKDGIFKANQMIMTDTNLTEENRKQMFYKERRQGKNNILICSMCKGFYDSNSIYKHKASCLEAENTTTPPVSLPVSMIEEYEESDEFKLQIVAKFRQDTVGQLCQKDGFIKLLGRQNFKRVLVRKEKSSELKEKIMSDMRRFGTLFLEFKSIAEVQKHQISSSSDMLSREYFQYLQEAIEHVTLNEDGTVKSGLKTGIGYLLKRAAKVLKGHYLLNRDDDKAAEVDNFSTLLTYFWPSMFSDAEYANVKARQLHLRRPKHLPDELQLQKLKTHVIEGIATVLDPYRMFSKHDYKTLRDLLVCRLTLFNARRGGEPSRLLLTEWEDAEKEEWIPELAVESISDPLEKKLMGKFKIAYQCGKNLAQMVPLLIPNDCIEGLRKLANADIREGVGVDARNGFLFPNTQSSSEHIKGWHAVQSVCTAAGLPNMITATSMRHRAATIYASLDVPENDRKAFYRHMGHSEEINKHVYQCPLAIQEMTKVGKFLDDIDSTSVLRNTELENEGNIPDTATPTSSQSESSRLRDEDIPSKARRGVVQKYSQQDDDRSSDEDDREITFRQATSSALENERTDAAVLSTSRPNRNILKCPTTTTLSSEDEDNDADKDYECKESDESSEDDYVFQKEKSSSCSKLHSKKKTQVQQESRFRWTAEATRTVLNYFPKIVSDTSSYDRKGSLPGKDEVLKLLKKHPGLFDSERFDLARQVLLVRTKLYNERNRARRLIKNQLDVLSR